MPETYGIPDEEPTHQARVQKAVDSILAGQHVTRTVALYAITGLLIISPAAPLAIVPLLLLMSSDLRLS